MSYSLEGIVSQELFMVNAALPVNRCVLISSNKETITSQSNRTFVYKDIIGVLLGYYLLLTSDAIKDHTK